MWHIGSLPHLSPGPGMTLWEAAVLELSIWPMFPERPAVTTAQVVEVIPAGLPELRALTAGVRDDDDREGGSPRWPHMRSAG